jgi:hypothetical protein
MWFVLVTGKLIKFIIYDRGWAGKINLTTKQDVLPLPAPQKKLNDPFHMNSMGGGGGGGSK